MTQPESDSEPGYCPVCGEHAGPREGDGDATCAFGHRLGRHELLTEAEVYRRWCRRADAAGLPQAA